MIKSKFNITYSNKNRYIKLNKFQEIKTSKLIRVEKIFKHQINQLDELKYDGFVYVIGNFRYKFFKIGYSSDPYKRLSSIQTGCPFQVSVVLIFNADMNYEKKLHRKFRKENTVGEWFINKGKFNKWLSSKLNALYIQMGEAKNLNEQV